VSSKVHVMQCTCFALRSWFTNMCKHNRLMCSTKIYKDWKLMQATMFVLTLLKINKFLYLHYKTNFGLLEHWKIISIRSFYLSSCLLIQSCNWKTNSNSIYHGINCCSLFAYYLWMIQRQYNNLLILSNVKTNIVACINFQSLYIFVEHIKRLILFWLDTGTSIKGGGSILVLWAQA
jgi:hypothetical protein